MSTLGHHITFERNFIHYVNFKPREITCREIIQLLNAYFTFPEISTIGKKIPPDKFLCDCPVSTQLTSIVWVPTKNGERGSKFLWYWSFVYLGWCWFWNYKETSWRRALHKITGEKNRKELFMTDGTQNHLTGLCIIFIRTAPSITDANIGKVKLFHINHRSPFIILTSQVKLYPRM